MAVPESVQLPLFVAEKLCRVCKTPTPLDRMRKDSRASDGRATICKSCGNAASKAYHAQHRERLLGDMKTRRLSNREERREADKAYFHEHREKHLAGQRERYARLESAERSLRKRRAYAARRDAAIAYRRAYYAAHAPALRIDLRQRDRRRRGAPGRYTIEDIRALESSQAGLCAYCALPYGKYEIEHKQPLSRGGTNWPANLCLACRDCNGRKYTRTDAEFRALLAAERSCAPGGRRGPVRS